MSRKKKKQANESVTETQTVESSETIELEPTENALPAEEAVEPTLIHLSDAARRFAKGFKEHWIPGILSHAQSRGLPLYATEEECKHILRMWGASVD